MKIVLVASLVLCAVAFNDARPDGKLAHPRHCFWLEGFYVWRDYITSEASLIASADEATVKKLTFDRIEMTQTYYRAVAGWLKSLERNDGKAKRETPPEIVEELRKVWEEISSHVEWKDVMSKIAAQSKTIRNFLKNADDMLDYFKKHFEEIVPKGKSFKQFLVMGLGMQAHMIDMAGKDLADSLSCPYLPATSRAPVNNEEEEEKFPACYALAQFRVWRDYLVSESKLVAKSDPKVLHRVIMIRLKSALRYYRGLTRWLQSLTEKSKRQISEMPSPMPDIPDIPLPEIPEPKIPKEVIEFFKELAKDVDWKGIRSTLVKHSKQAVEGLKSITQMLDGLVKSDLHLPDELDLQEVTVNGLRYQAHMIDMAGSKLAKKLGCKYETRKGILDFPDLPKLPRPEAVLDPIDLEEEVMQLEGEKVAAKVNPKH